MFIIRSSSPIEYWSISLNNHWWAIRIWKRHGLSPSTKPRKPIFWLRDSFCTCFQTWVTMVEFHSQLCVGTANFRRFTGSSTWCRMLSTPHSNLAAQKANATACAKESFSSTHLSTMIHLVKYFFLSFAFKNRCMVSKININNGIKKRTRGYQICDTKGRLIVRVGS